MRPLPGHFAHAISPSRVQRVFKPLGRRRVCALLQYGAQLSSVDVPKPICSVLIVEDDEDDVFLLNRAFDDVRRILRRDIKTEHIENGLEALYLVSRQDLTENLPDILVLDLNMPKLDGMKFLRSLRQSLFLKDLPVFVLTTTTAKSIHEEAMRAGADKVYVKPDDAKALLSIALDMVGAGCGLGGEARHA
jgi:two-component system chemotaxis response regulator CheY